MLALTTIVKFLLALVWDRSLFLGDADENLVKQIKKSAIEIVCSDRIQL